MREPGTYRISSRLVERLTSAERVVALTGAGASAESGIPTFRDPEGLWSKFNPAELASMPGFLRDPVRVQSWYAARRRGVLSAEPHAGHLALAEIERRVPSFTLVTQNVDGLHTRAGSRNIIEIHGSLLNYSCIDCERDSEPLEIEPDADAPARCRVCGGLIRPDVVWFGEMLDPDRLIRAQAAAASCDFFLSIGTGADVYPAAALPEEARAGGAYVVEINTRPTAITRRVDEVLTGPASEILPELLEILIPAG